MDYLEYMGIVHRDLAARNVLGKTDLFHFGDSVFHHLCALFDVCYHVTFAKNAKIVYSCRLKFFLNGRAVCLG